MLGIKLDSSCVSKRDRAPELVIVRLTAAMECESGRSKTAAPSYCPPSGLPGI
jgi:hypothetical protein